jgi:hypothetical protein
MSASTTAGPNKKPASGPPTAPPDEQFWNRYSPHYEFPLSSVTSVAVHILALVLLTLVAFWIAKLSSARDKPLDEQALTFGGGGGGNPKGAGAGPGVGAEAAPQEDVPDKPREDTPKPVDRNDSELPKGKPTARVPPVEIKDPDFQQMFEKAKGATQQIARLKKDTRDKLLQGVAGEGKGGPGREGGRERGVDKGTGRGVGEGDGKLSQREKRVLRWVMVFDTFDGNDYARQLAGLGAYLAIPQPGGEYRLIKDLLARPVTGQIEDLSHIKRIFWVDDKRESVYALCHALGVSPIPEHVVAFFPEKLEHKLLNMELKYKGLREEEIYETRFKIRKRGGGYEPEVTEQTKK